MSERTKRGSTAFVPLHPSDWQEERTGDKSSWRCRVLELPGTRFCALWYRRLETVSPVCYEQKGNRIRWHNGIPPEGLQVEVILPRRLGTRREAALAAILGLVLGGFVGTQHPDGLSRLVSRGIVAAAAELAHLAAPAAEAAVVAPHLSSAPTH